MPMSCAASLSSETARMAFPARVYLTMYCSASMSAMVVAKITICCMVMSTLPMWKVFAMKPVMAG